MPNYDLPAVYSVLISQHNEIQSVWEGCHIEIINQIPVIIYF